MNHVERAAEGFEAGLGVAAFAGLSAFHGAIRAVADARRQAAFNNHVAVRTAQLVGSKMAARDAQAADRARVDALVMRYNAARYNASVAA